MEKEKPDVFTVNETAEFLRVSVRTVYRLIESGQLKATKVGRVWRVRREDIDTFLAGR